MRVNQGIRKGCKAGGKCYKKKCTTLRLVSLSLSSSALSCSQCSTIAIDASQRYGITSHSTYSNHRAFDLERHACLCKSKEVMNLAKPANPLPEKHRMRSLSSNNSLHLGRSEVTMSKTQHTLSDRYCFFYRRVVEGLRGMRFAMLLLHTSCICGREPLIVTYSALQFCARMRNGTNPSPHTPRELGEL